MTERLSLTAAEVAFLLSSRGDEGSSEIAATLGLTEVDFTEGVRAAGLGSLLLRQLAAPAHDQQIQVAPPVAAIAEGLATHRALIQVALVAVGGTDSSMLVESPLVRFLISPRAYRCFDVTGLDPSADLGEPLMHVADAFLQQFRPAVCTFSTSRDGGVESVSLAAGEDGLWRFIAGADADAAVTTADPADARRMLRQGLEALAPARAG